MWFYWDRIRSCSGGLDGVGMPAAKQCRPRNGSGSVIVSIVRTARTPANFLTGHNPPLNMIARVVYSFHVKLWSCRQNFPEV